MAYVQVAQSVLTHRKTLRLARLLNMDRYAVVGRLVAFWSWSLDNAPRGCLADVEPDILADVLDYDGKPAELIEAMLTAGFLDLDMQGHWWIHGWDETMLPYIEGKEKNAARMRDARARERVEREAAMADTLQAPAADVAPQERAMHVQRTFAARADVEERREEKISDPPVVTTGEDSSGEREMASSLTLGSLALSPAPTPRNLVALPAPTPIALPATIPKPVSKPASNGLAKPASKPRAPDPLWDACVVACDGNAPSNDVERGKWNKGLAALRQSHATPEEIGIRAVRYKRRYGEGIPINPMALASNWTVLATEVQDHATSQAKGNGSAHNGSDRGGGSQRGATRPSYQSPKPLPDADYWREYEQQLEREGRLAKPKNPSGKLPAVQ